MPKVRAGLGVGDPSAGEGRSGREAGLKLDQVLQGLLELLRASPTSPEEGGGEEAPGSFCPWGSAFSGTQLSSFSHRREQDVGSLNQRVGSGKQ